MKCLRLRRLPHFAAAASVLSCGGATDGSDPGPGDTPFRTIDNDTVVFLERTECYGSCPVYSLTIGGNGTITYFGRKYVNVKGEATKQVSRREVQALVDQMLEAEYYRLSVPEDCAEGLFTDAAGARTSLTLHGQTHSVDHDYGNPCAPASLRLIEDAIDVLAHSAAWLECDTPSGACCDPAANPYLAPCGQQSPQP